MRVNLALIRLPSVFDSLHHLGLERVPFLDQLIYALGIRTFDIGEALQAPRLPARSRANSRCR